MADLVHNRLLKIWIDLLEPEYRFTDNVIPVYATLFLKLMCDKYAWSVKAAHELVIFPSRYGERNQSDWGLGGGRLVHCRAR